MKALLRAALAPFSPRHRRWRRLLGSLTLDPDELSLPLAAPPTGDFIVCGAPRTGTTLLAATLFQPPGVVTAMEPWDGLRLPPAELFAAIRREIERTGRLTGSKLDVPALLADGRVEWAAAERRRVAIEGGRGFRLGVKWPAFWRYLPLLPTTRFLVCLRDPGEVVASFRRIGGRLEQGLEYDVAFNRRMNRTLERATRDPAVRRVLLFDYVHARLLPYLERPNVMAVRYERWFSEPETLLAEVSAFLGLPLDRSPARVKDRESSAALPAADAHLLGELCTTATALGYPLERAEAVRPEAPSRLVAR